MTLNGISATHSQHGEKERPPKCLFPKQTVAFNPENQQLTVNNKNVQSYTIFKSEQKINFSINIFGICGYLWKEPYQRDVRLFFFMHTVTLTQTEMAEK